jgi:hypothetical protein
MNDNMIKNIKNMYDTTSKNILTTYNTASKNILTTITPIVQYVKPSIKTPEIIKPSPEIKPTIEIIEPEINKLSPFEKQYESSFIGCFMDDPINPSMKTLLGQVSNISECINLGKNNNFKYVGLRGGNECYASNDIPSTQSMDRFQYCNVGCDDIGSGNCGGFFYNQVYKTSNLNEMPKLKSESESESELKSELKQNNITGILENFINSDNDINKINIGLNNESFNCWKPMNSYIFFFWLVVILLLIYILFEYLYRNKNNKII